MCTSPRVDLTEVVTATMPTPSRASSRLLLSFKDRRVVGTAEKSLFKDCSRFAPTGVIALGC